MWPRQGWERRAPCEPASRRCCRPRLCLSPWSKFTQALFISNTTLCTVSHHQSANTHVRTHTLCEIPMAILTCWLTMKRCPKVSRKFPVLKDGLLSDCTFPFKLHYFLVVYELSCLASLFCFEKCKKMAKAVEGILNAPEYFTPSTHKCWMVMQPQTLSEAPTVFIFRFLVCNMAGFLHTTDHTRNRVLALNSPKMFWWSLRLCISLNQA